MVSNNAVAFLFTHGLGELITFGRNVTDPEWLERNVSCWSPCAASTRGGAVISVASANSQRHGRCRELRMAARTEGSVSNGAARAQDLPYLWTARPRWNATADRSARS
jgi:hypothetical protein